MSPFSDGTANAEFGGFREEQRWMDGIIHLSVSQNPRKTVYGPGTMGRHC